MSVVREITRAIRLILVLWVLTAIIYPLVMIGVGQVFFRFRLTAASCRISKDKISVRL